MDGSRHNQPTWNHLQPTIYKFIIGLALLLVVAVWELLGGRGDTGIVLGAVSVFICIVITLQLALWTISRRRRPHASLDSDGPAPTLHDWLTGEFETLNGKMKASDAAIEILLPISAVSVGMLLLLMVLDVVRNVSS